MLHRKSLVIGCLPLILAVLVCSRVYARHRHHVLAVTDISGYYVAVNKDELRKTLYIHLSKPYMNEGFEQADFNGRFSDFRIVGQGVISGDEGELDDRISFNFMYLEPQDEAAIKYCTTTQDNDGNVVAVFVSEDEELKSYTKYRRVSRAQYLQVYAHSESHFFSSVGRLRTNRSGNKSCGKAYRARLTNELQDSVRVKIHAPAARLDDHAGTL